MRKKRILSVGNCVMTLRAAMNAVPQKGEKTESCGEYCFMPDGRGVRLSVALSLAGADSVVCSRMGEDYYEKRLSAFLNQNGVDTRFVTTEKNADTAFSLIMEEKDGAVREVFYPGVSAGFCEDDVESAFLSIPDAVIDSSETPGRVTRFAARLAQMKKVPFFYYATTSDKDIALTNAAPLFLLYLDSATAAELTGIPPVSQDTCSRSAFRLGELYDTKFVLIRLDGGFYLYDGKYTEFCEAVPHRSFDDDGADEAFMANLALEYCETGDISRAVKFAAAAWAITDSRRGGVETLPSREETEEFIAGTEEK